MSTASCQAFTGDLSLISSTKFIATSSVNMTSPPFSLSGTSSMSNFFTLSLSLSFLRTPLLCLSLCFRLVSFFKSIFQFILFLLGLISCLIQSLSFSIIIVSSFSNLLVFFYNILFLMLPILSLRILNIVKILYILCVNIPLSAVLGEGGVQILSFVYFCSM